MSTSGFAMTAADRQLLNSFDALAASEQHQAAVEILRRVPASAEGDLSDQCLLEVADELFRTMDAEEARHAKS